MEKNVMNKSDVTERKFIESYNVSDYEILTDTGWEDIDSIHKTIPYDCWSIETESGKKFQIDWKNELLTEIKDDATLDPNQKLFEGKDITIEQFAEDQKETAKSLKEIGMFNIQSFIEIYCDTNNIDLTKNKLIIDYNQIEKYLESKC